MPEIDDSIHCSTSCYTSGRSADIDHIVVHYTGSEGSARNNATYFHNGGSGSSSAHYFMDGGGIIYKSVYESDTAWHAGNWSMNSRAIGIEVCSNGEDFTEDEIEELKWLVGRIMEEYGIPAENVIRHYDVTGKLCPYPYIDWDKWVELHDYITGGNMALSQEDVDKVVYGILGFNNQITAKEVEGMDFYQNVWNAGHIYNKVCEMYDVVVKGGEERKKEIAEVKKELRAVSESLSAVSTSVASLEQNVAKLEERVAKLEEDAY